jgi:cobalt-zinc-cadmium efflux system protein
VSGGAARRALAISLGITIVFMAAEAIGGYFANSLALMADAGHMLTDAASLGLALFAIWVSVRPPNDRRTYGYLRAEVLAAFVNGCILVLIAAGIFWECWERFFKPEAVDVRIMLPVAIAGFLANGASAYILHGQHEHQLNARAAYLHVIGDLAGAGGAIVAAIVIWATGWTLADPILSVLVGVLMLIGAWRIVWQAVEVLLEAVPAHIDLAALERELAKVDGVGGVHDLHVWTIASGVHVLTCHAVLGAGRADYSETLERLSCLVRERFKIDHATFQLESEGFMAKESGIAHCAREGGKS